MGLAHAHVDHIPGQQLVSGKLPVCVERRIHAALFKGPHPAVKGEVVRPGVKPSATAPDLLDHVGHAPVPTGQSSLNKTGLRVVPVVGHVPRNQAGAEQIHPAEIFLNADLRLPLEGAVGLGDKAGSGDGDLHAPVLVLRILPPAVEHLIGHLRDAHDVLVCLRGQAQHVIELHAVPAALKGDAAGVQQILLGDVLVDGVSQPLASALHGKGQAAFSHLLQPLHDLHGEVVRPQGRQGQADAPLLAVVQQPVTELREGSVVAGTEGEQGHILVSGVFQGLYSLPDQGLRLFGTDGPVHMARLTEAAAPDAAPEQLQVHPVMDHLSGGDNGLCGKRRGVKVFHNALCHLLRRAVLCDDGGQSAVGLVRHIVEAGHINAADLRRLHEEVVL